VNSAHRNEYVAAFVERAGKAGRWWRVITVRACGATRRSYFGFIVEYEYDTVTDGWLVSVDLYYAVGAVGTYVQVIGFAEFFPGCL